MEAKERMDCVSQKPWGIFTPFTLRRLIIDSYIAFYLVNEEERQVIFMRILYGRQEYEHLF